MTITDSDVATATDNRSIDIDLSQVRIAHLDLGPGRVTIAWSEEDGIIHYAVSLCSPSDQFCRRAGRIRAIGRLHSTRQSFVFGVKGLPEERRDRIQAVLDAIMWDVKMPAQWAKKGEQDVHVE